MMLEWIQNDVTYSFHIIVVPPLPQVNFSASTQAQIKVPYNVAYNVSLLVSSCGQYNVTAFVKEVFYGELLDIVCTLSNNEHFTCSIY